MEGLLLALYLLNERASYAVLQVLLDHSSPKITADLVKRAAEKGLVARPGSRGAVVELTDAGRHELARRLNSPPVLQRFHEAHQERAAAAGRA